MAHKQCPSGEHELRSIPVGEARADICDECHSIWLGASLLKALAADLSMSGWIGYVHYDEVSDRGLPCPDCGLPMTVRQATTTQIQQCRNCHGLFMPGNILTAMHENARRRAGNDEPFPVMTDRGIRIDPAALAVGFDPRVVDDLLMTSAGVWLLDR